jgi:AAA+ ATPase superfamily predicted ATPase
MGSILLDAPDLVMPSGTRNKEIYNSILFSISRGKSSPTEIGNDLGMGANEVSKYLGVLSLEEIIEKKAMFGSKRKIVYRIKDPLLLFYYASLYEDVERIRIGYGEVVFQEKKEQIHQRICHGFEDVCLHYLESASVQGKLPHPYYPIQSLVIEHSELGRSIEIDGLSRYGDSLLIVECKYTEKKRGLKDFSDMKQDASIRMFSSVKEKEFYLFSKNGFEDPLRSLIMKNLHLFDAKDLLSEKV